MRSPHQARWLLLRSTDDLRVEGQVYRAALLEEHSDIERTQQLAEEFGRLIRARDQAALPPWLDQAERSGVPELREFVAGIRRDRAAVAAALSQEWSSGQTEGQINRLKFLKRQMYGRASFDLLRRRVLRAA